MSSALLEPSTKNLAYIYKEENKEEKIFFAND